MGIKRLNSVLSSHDALIKYNNIFEFKKKNGFKKKLVIGIDFMLYAFKFKISLDNILIGFINQILQFLSNNIIPIYIIDGCANLSKKDTINKRNIKREKLTNEVEKLKLMLLNDLDSGEKTDIENKISKFIKLNKKVEANDIKIALDLFKLLNINFIRAKGEADILLSYLFKNQIINYCLSEDMDLIVYGCENMIKIKNKSVIEYNLKKILDKLNLKYDEFIELCIFLGCDYLNCNLKYKPDVIYSKYLTLKDKFIENNNFSNEYKMKFYEAKSNYKYSYQEYESLSIEISNKKINYDELTCFINENCKLYKNNNLIKIVKKINSKII